MSTQLIQILAFADVANGATEVLAHNINVNGRKLVPDLIGFDVAGFSVVAIDDDSIEIQNDSGAEASVNVWLEFKQTTQRWFGAQQTENLTPHPFVFSPGGGSGGSAVVTDLTLFGDGSAETPLTSRAAEVFRLYNDFCSLKEVTSVVTATGTVALATASNYGLGVVRLRTPAEGDAAAANLSDSIANIRTSNKVFDGYVEFSLASDGIPPGAGDDYIFRCGLSDEPDGAAGNIGNGWMFALSLAKFGVATWCLVKDDVTFVDTGAANDGLPHTFRIEFGRAADASCYMRGYIDGVLEASMDPGDNWTPVVLGLASLQNVGQSEGLNFFVDFLDVAIKIDRDGAA